MTECISTVCQCVFYISPQVSESKALISLIAYSFNMVTKSFFQIIALLVVLFQAGLATSDTNKTPSTSCHCRPVINVSVDGNGQCDLCDENSKLLQEVNDLKKELATIKNQISQIQPIKSETPALCFAKIIAKQARIQFNSVIP